MGIVFRQSVKTIIVTFTGALLGAAIYYINSIMLSEQKFGFIRNIINTGALFQFLALFGAAGTILTYAQRYHEPKRKKLLLTICSIVPVVVTILLLVPYLALKKYLIELYQPADRQYVADYYLLIPLLILFWSYMTLIEYYLVTQHKVTIASFSREILLRLLTIVFVVLFYYGAIDFTWLVIASVLVYAAPVIAMLWAARKTDNFGFSFQWNTFSRKEYLELFRFSWYHLLLGISFFSMGFVDSLMLAPLSKDGMSAVAVYSFAIFIVSFMTIPFRSMTAAAFPELNKAYIANDIVRVKELFQRSGINIMIITVLMVLLIGCNLHNAVAILPDNYAPVYGVCFVLMLGRFIDMLTGLNTEAINISPYYKFNFRISTLLMFLLIGINYILIPRYGIYGAAWGSTISLSVYNLAKMFYLWKKMKLLPFTAKSPLVLLAGSITSLPGFFIPFMINPFVDAVLRSGIIIIIYMLLLFWFRPSEDLGAYIATIKKNKRLF